MNVKCDYEFCQLDGAAIEVKRDVSELNVISPVSGLSLYVYVNSLFLAIHLVHWQSVCSAICRHHV